MRNIISGNPSYFPAVFVISLLSHSPHSASFFPSPYFSSLPPPSILPPSLPLSLLASFPPSLLLFFFSTFLSSFLLFFLFLFLPFTESFYKSRSTLHFVILLLSPVNSRVTDVYYHNCSVIVFFFNILAS